MDKLINNDQVVAFDCDDTLIMWDQEFPETTFAGIPISFHHEHIRKLKEHKARNHFVIVWSAGGSEWAQAVVDLLELNQYVDLVLCKPLWMYDDVSPENWTKLIYVKQKTNIKKS